MFSPPLDFPSSPRDNFKAALTKHRSLSISRGQQAFKLVSPKVLSVYAGAPQPQEEDQIPLSPAARAEEALERFSKQTGAS